MSPFFLHAQDGTATDGLLLTGVQPDAAASSTGDTVPCTFDVTYSVPAGMPATGIVLNYQFVMKIDDTYKFKLIAAPVTLVSASGPNLSLALFTEKFDPPSDLGGGSYQLNWHISLQVAETSNSQIAAGSVPSVINTSMQCGSSALQVVPSNPSLQTVGNTKQLQFTVSKVFSPTDHLDLNSTAGLTKCYLNGTVRFTLAAGPTVDRPLASGQGIELLFPPASQPAVTTTPPNPASVPVPHET